MARSWISFKEEQPESGKDIVVRLKSGDHRAIDNCYLHELDILNVEFWFYQLSAPGTPIGRPRKLTFEKYSDVWLQLSQGVTIGKLARQNKLAQSSVSFMTEEGSYSDWFALLDPEIVKTARRKIKARRSRYAGSSKPASTHPWKA